MNNSWCDLPMIFTRDFVTRKKLLANRLIRDAKLLFTVTHVLFYISHFQSLNDLLHIFAQKLQHKRTNMYWKTPGGHTVFISVKLSVEHFCSQHVYPVPLQQKSKFWFRIICGRCWHDPHYLRRVSDLFHDHKTGNYVDKTCAMLLYVRCRGNSSSNKSLITWGPNYLRQIRKISWLLMAWPLRRQTISSLDIFYLKSDRPCFEWEWIFPTFLYRYTWCEMQIHFHISWRKSSA